MLSDPVSLTVGGVAKSLPRGTGPMPDSIVGNSQPSFYSTADGEFVLAIWQGRTALRGDNAVRVTLTKRVHDVEESSTMFTGTVYPSVSVEVITDPNGTGKASIADIRSALNAFLDGTNVLNRLIAGEH